MGQQASKLAKSVQQAAASAKQKSNAGGAVAVQQQQTSQRFTDPNATEAGFTRGEGAVVDARDARQRQFLEEKAGGAEFKEMPDDLVKFLKDVGPIQPKAERKRTKRLDAKGQPSGQKHVAPPRAGEIVDSSPRKRESMRLAADVEGFDTVRTTSFSNKQDLEDPRDFSVGDTLDLYSLIVRKHTAPSVTDAVESFYQERIKDRDVDWTEEEASRHRELVRNSMEFLELPVVMKDTDETYVGAYPERVAELQQLKIAQVAKERVRLVLEDLAEQKKEEGNA